MAIRPIDDAGIQTPRGPIVGPNFQPYVSGGIFAGPLLKPQYTNQLLWSEDLTNAAWQKSGFSSTSQVSVSNQLFVSATQFTTTSTTGLVFQSMPSSAMVTGGCYQMTAWMRLVSGNANAQFGIGGQLAQKVSGVVLTSSWQQVNINTLVGRDATQTVSDVRASGNIYGAYFYIPSGTVVEISGVQITLGNFVEPYVRTTSSYGRVAPLYESGCMYVARRERNYMIQSNLNPSSTLGFTSTLAGVGSGVFNLTTGSETPIGVKNIARLVNNSTSASTRGVAKLVSVGPSSSTDVVKPFQLAITVGSRNSDVFRMDYVHDVLGSPTAAGVMASFGGGIDGVFDSYTGTTGLVTQLGDGWGSLAVIPGPSSPNGLALLSGQNILFSPRVFACRDSSVNYQNSFSIPDEFFIANFQALDTYHIPSFFVTGSSSGEVTGDIVSVGPSSLWDHNQGTFLIDFYVDEYFGIASSGDDRYIRTILDCAETETLNRIRFFKNKSSHSYGLEVYNQSGTMVSGGFNLTLPIGWHRSQINFTQSNVTVFIDGVQRVTLNYSGGRSAGSVINIGSNRFNTWENYGGYLKNFHIFDSVQPSSVSSDQQTGFSNYASKESTTITDDISGLGMRNILWSVRDGASISVTGGISDPLGGFGASRVRISGGTGTVKSVYLTKFNFFRQSATYSNDVWMRMITNTGTTATFSINGLASVSFNGLSSWTRLTASTNVAVGGNIGGISQLTVINNDTSGAGVLEFEIFDPKFFVSYTRTRRVFNANTVSELPVGTNGLRFKHKLGSQFNYGISGTWESEVLDTGAKRPGIRYIGKDVVDSKPGQSTISYSFAASDNASGPFVYTDNISQISGRYVKVLARVNVEDVSQGYPEIVSVKLVPESKTS